MSSPHRQSRYLLLLCSLLCALATRAEAPSASIDPRAIVALVERTILQELRNSPLARGATRVDVRGGALDSRLRLDACARQPRVEFDAARLQRRVNAKVICAAPLPWSIYVPAELSVFRRVVVSARALQSGVALTAQDLELAERDVLASHAPTIPSPDQVVGLTLRRPVQANALITASLLRQPLVVRRGDRLTVRSQSGGIEVQAAAEALESGRSGERIRARNLQSRRVLEVTVAGPGAARVP